MSTVGIIKVSATCPIFDSTEYPYWKNKMHMNLEAIDVNRNFMSDEQLTGYHLGNLLKYLIRYRKKNGIEDLEKAKVHMDWLIEKEKAMLLQLEALVGGENDQ